MEAGEFRQLCQLTGIRPVAPAGVDIEATLSGEDRRAFFAAWDCIPSHGSIAGGIADLRRQRWQQVLPPVLVMDEGTNPMTVVLHLPEAMLAHPLHWQLIEENEGNREGTVLPTELEVLEQAEVERERYVALRLPLQLEPTAGYHRLTATGSDGDERQVDGECVLIVTPPTCYTPSGLIKEGKIWGLSGELTTIRSRRNWGCGDLTDLLTLLSWAADNGAGTVAVSSLLSRQMPEDVQLPPALPSDRCFPDPLFLDPEAIADFAESEEARALVNAPAFQVRLALVRETEELDATEVAALKKEVAEVLWRHFQLNHLNPETERGWEYRHFQEAGGQRLEAFALYQTLLEDRRTMTEETAEADIAPVSLPAYGSAEATAYADSRRERIEYHQYLQWQLELQLAAAGKRSMELGLKVGLTQTLPAGVAPHGFAVWHQPRLFGSGLQVHDSSATGICHPSGLPILPSRMTALAYEPFIAMLRSNMRHAGALRFKSIDLLDRQWWRLPNDDGESALCIAMPGEDLLGIVALESMRNRCLVIGEHQGPLSDSFSQALRSRDILVSRPGWYARDPQGDWLAPSS